MYKFNKDLTLINFFRFDKMNIKNKKWSRLPKASKSIYPVIVVHCNTKGIAYPSELTLAILSGRTPKTVRAGIAGLMYYPGFTIERYVTSRGHRALRYVLNIPPNEKGRTFNLYKCIVTGGNWSLLTPGAQALYPVMKTFSFFDGDEYSDREGTEFGYDIQGMIEAGEFQIRKYDFCNADLNILSEYAGIGKKTTINGLEKLEDNFLIKKTDPIDDRDTWKVYRVPPKIFKSDWLNEKALKRYGKTFQEKITY